MLEEVGRWSGMSADTTNFFLDVPYYYVVVVDFILFQSALFLTLRPPVTFELVSGELPSDVLSRRKLQIYLHLMNRIWSSSHCWKCY